MSEAVEKRNKKPIYQRTWFIIVVVLFVLGLISNSFSTDGQSGTAQSEGDPSEQVETDSPPQNEETEDAVADQPEPQPEPLEFAWPQMKETIIEGNGDDVVILDEEIPLVAAMDVVGNASSRYFGVKPIYANGDSGSSLVNTTDVFEGTVLLLGSSGEQIAGFEVSANGPWSLSIKSVSEVPKLIKGETFEGTGDGLLRLDETQGLTTISVVGNSEGRYFGVRPHGSSSFSVINTTDPYDGRVRLEPGTLLLEITAIGDWSIEID